MGALVVVALFGAFIEFGRRQQIAAAEENCLNDDSTAMVGAFLGGTRAICECVGEKVGSFYSFGDALSDFLVIVSDTPEEEQYARLRLAYQSAYRACVGG